MTLFGIEVPKLPITVSPRVRKILKYSGYPAFYLFCLFTFGYYTFPYERLKDRLLVELEAQRANNPSAQRVEIESLGPYWFSGISLTGVHLVSPPAPSADADKPPSKMTIDKAHVRLSLLPLLIGRVSLTFGATAFGGNIDGSTRSNSDGRFIEAELSGLDVSKMDMLGDVIGGLPLAGKLDGKIDWSLPGQKLAKSNGTVTLTITDLAAGDGKSKIAGKLALPKLNVGAFEFSAEAKDGLLKVDKLGAQGQDLDLAGEGKLSLRDPFGDTLADLYLRFRFADGYKNRNDMTKSLFGAPGSPMPALFELADPRIKTAKRPDGFYGWHMSGLVKDPRFEPAPTGGGGSSGARPGSTR